MKQIAGRPIERIRVFVDPLAIRLAGKTTAATPYEGKFSLAFTTALSLTGRSAAQADFTDSTVKDAALQSVLPKVVLVPVSDMALTAATLEVDLQDGTALRAHTPLALGNPGRAMNWDDMQAKFMSLAEPVIGSVRSMPHSTSWQRYCRKSRLAM